MQEFKSPTPSPTTSQQQCHHLTKQLLQLQRRYAVMASRPSTKLGSQTFPTSTKHCNIRLLRHLRERKASYLRQHSLPTSSFLQFSLEYGRFTIPYPRPYLCRHIRCTGNTYSRLQLKNLVRVFSSVYESQSATLFKMKLETRHKY